MANAFEHIRPEGEEPTLARQAETIPVANAFDSIQPAAQAAPPGNNPYLDELNAEYGPLDRFAVGYGQGTDKYVSGIKGLFKGDEYTQRKQQEHADYQKSDVGSSGMANIGEFVGNTAPTLLFPAAKAGPVLRGAYNIGLSGLEELLNMPEQGETREGNAASGALGGYVGGEIGAHFSKLIPDWLKNLTRRGTGQASVDAQYLDRVEELKRIGIENPTLDEITGSHADISQGSTVRSSGTPKGAEYRERKGQSNKGMGDTLGAMVDQYNAKSDDVYGVGTEIIDGIQTGRKAASQAGGRMYDDIRDNMPSSMVDLERTMDKIMWKSEEIADDAPMRQIVGRIKRLMGDEWQEDVTPVLGAQQFEAVRRQAVKLMNASTGDTKTGLKEVISEMEKDAEKAFGKDIYSAARENYAKNVFGVYDNQKIAKQMLDGKVAPEDVVNKVMTGSYKADDISPLMRALHPDQQNELRAGVMMHLRKKAQNGIQMDEFQNPVIYGGNLKRELSKNGMKQKMDTILGPENSKILYEISELMHSITSAPRGSISTSGSGEFLANFMGTLKKAVKIPILSNLIEPMIKGGKDSDIENMALRLLRPQNSNIPESLYNPFQRAAREMGSEAGSGIYGVKQPEQQ